MKLSLIILTILSLSYNTNASATRKLAATRKLSDEDDTESTTRNLKWVLVDESSIATNEEGKRYLRGGRGGSRRVDVFDEGLGLDVDGFAGAGIAGGGIVAGGVVGGAIIEETVIGIHGSKWSKSKWSSSKGSKGHHGSRRYFDGPRSIIDGYLRKLYTPGDGILDVDVADGEILDIDVNEGVVVGAAIGGGVVETGVVGGGGAAAVGVVGVGGAAVVEETVIAVDDFSTSKWSKKGKKGKHWKGHGHSKGTRLRGAVLVDDVVGAAIVGDDY